MTKLTHDEAGYPVLLSDGAEVSAGGSQEAQSLNGNAGRAATAIAKLTHDEAGFPVLLADGAKASVTVKESPSANGNGPQKPVQGMGRPAHVDSMEWARRMDAVRDFAREFETFTVQDVEELLRGRSNRALTPEEIASFTADVHDQQLNDLVDMLDRAERGTLRGRRTVKVTAPKGYIRKTVNALSDDELKQVAQRLRARGWNDKQIVKLQNRLPEARRPNLEGLNEVDIARVEYDIEHAGSVNMLDAVRDLVVEVASHLPAPIIKVDTPVVTRKNVIRDDQTGLLIGIEEVRADGGPT
jgi:hypothetical protein